MSESNIMALLINSVVLNCSNIHLQHLQHFKVVSCPKNTVLHNIVPLLTKKYFKELFRMSKHGIAMVHFFGNYFVNVAAFNNI